jgi:putative ABC transport system permease protein
MFSVATVFLLLASLIAAAGFAVIAQRRLRHLGMLAAIGATQKHLRLVLMANGAIVGAIAALFGTLIGLALWVVFAPTLESAVDHRVDRLSLPWLLIALTVLLALFGAIAAAWWPGRTVARLPVTLALSGRPPKPRPARHSAIAAAALIAVGIGCLALSNRDRPPLIVTGIVATIIGCLLIGPLAIRVFSGLARRVSIAPRLALRDLARYQARSGAALAAVTLALGIAATVVSIASAEAAKKAAEPANLSDRQARVYLGPPEARELTPVDTPAQLEGLAARVRVMKPSNSREEGKSSRSALYVATPAVLRYLGIDPATVASGTDFLVDRSLRTDDLIIPDMTSRRKIPVTNVQKSEVGNHLFGSDNARTPPTFITLNGLRRHGWNQIPAGWLIDSSRPLTSDQIADDRNIAANAGLTIEAQNGKPSYAKTMAIATGAGALLALAILAMTVGLIRSESAGDLRTLTATGATSGIRRRLTATTAGALAFLDAPRRSRRLRRPFGDVLRRPWLPERRTAPVPRRRSVRRPARRHRSRLAPRRTRAARNRQNRNPMTGHPLLTLRSFIMARLVVTDEAQLASWADRVVFLCDRHVSDRTVAPPGPESLLAAPDRQ